MRRLVVVLLLLLSAAPAFAVNPDEVLKDPALEARARALSAQLRCMVCQNQSIDDSNADLAKDLRLLVRERLTAGDSDDQVIEYLVSRYGEFVLLKPRLSEHTILLWGMPVALAAIGAGVVFVQLRRRRISLAGQELSAEEQSKLEALLKSRD
jgi:cytochrome c-type biogenesis protein CcmH